MGNKHFEISNHLGNVLLTFTDNKYQDLKINSATDYYPFGMSMKGREFQATRFRYGFNGKENDKWAFSQIQDYGFRLYLQALGRFASMDPLTASYPFYTPYQFAGNTPIKYIDIDGLEPGIDPNWLGHSTKTLLELKETKNLQIRVENYLQKNGVNIATKEGKALVSKCFITNFGRIFEDAVLKSYHLNKIPDTKEWNIFNGRRPDAYEDGELRTKSRNTFYPYSTLYEVKFQKTILLEGEYNKDQIKTYIDFLTNNNLQISLPKISYLWTKEAPPGKASKVGLAVLVFITPYGSTIDPEVVKYANDRNIKIYQMEVYHDPKDPKKIRVSYPKPVLAIVHDEDRKGNAVPEIVELDF